jgi:formylglycine-generating enzyme required for sulfatase activity
VWLAAAVLLAAGDAANAAGDGDERLGFSNTPPAAGPAIKTDRGYMVPYTAKIPGSDVTFEMTPISGGTFRMGSPATEKDRHSVEGPQFDVRIEPFWMSRYELTWAEYKQFMATYEVFKHLVALRETLSDAKPTDAAKRQQQSLLAALAGLDALGERLARREDGADAVTAPTKLYDPSYTFEHGDDAKLPAVTMTQYAARQYTKWLSGISGPFYRLPSEAEWEYACRAGSTSAYSFGDDVKRLGEYAWHFDNSDEKPHPVGKKKPNAWGLYDMHGNAAEWVLDELLDEGYKPFAQSSAGEPLAGKARPAAEAIVWPKRLFPRVVRGGSWDDEAPMLRSAARFGSHDRDWNATDPNRPLSPWWFTDDPSRGVGFRIIRPLVRPPKSDEAKYWDADIALVREDVAAKLKEGRGVQGVADPKLPDVIRQLEELKKRQAAGQKPSDGAKPAGAKAK